MKPRAPSQSTSSSRLRVRLEALLVALALLCVFGAAPAGAQYTGTVTVTGSAEVPEAYSLQQFSAIYSTSGTWTGSFSLVYDDAATDHSDCHADGSGTGVAGIVAVSFSDETHYSVSAGSSELIAGTSTGPVCDPYANQNPVGGTGYGVEPGGPSAPTLSGSYTIPPAPGQTGSVSWQLTQAPDADGDGVPDDQDHCPGTTPGVQVTANGCVDGSDQDGDGVPDGQDQCPGTPAGVQVMANGCASKAEGELTVGVRLINPELSSELAEGTPLPGFRYRIGALDIGFLNAGESLTRPAPAGTVSVVQDPVPTSWRLRRIECDDADSNGNVFSRTAHYALALGESVRCTFVNTPDLWDPLVGTAITQAAVAQQYGGGTRGYYNQVVNIVCAAGLNRRGSCDEMAPHYRQTPWAGDGYSPENENTKCAHHEAGCWVFNVFDSYLRINDDKAIQDARQIEGNAPEFVRLLCKAVIKFPADLGCWGLARTTEAQALYAGAVHFNTNLHPAFRVMTEDVVAGAKAQGPAAVRAAITKIVSQHEDLIADAVLPGFDVVYAGGGLTAFGKVVAQATVPFAAVCEREGAIERALTKPTTDGGTDGGYGSKLGHEYHKAWTTAPDWTTFTSVGCKGMLKMVDFVQAVTPSKSVDIADVTAVKSGLDVTVMAPRAGSMTGTATATTVGRKANAAATQRLAKGRVRVRRRSIQTLRLRATRAGRSALRKHRSITVRVNVRFRSGNRRPQRVTVRAVLRRLPGHGKAS